jgi:hypothetical protein
MGSLDFILFLFRFPVSPGKRREVFDYRTGGTWLVAVGRATVAHDPGLPGAPVQYGPVRDKFGRSGAHKYHVRLCMVRRVRTPSVPGYACEIRAD